MTIPYLARLIFLSLASFFFVNAGVAVVISISTPVAIRMGERLKPVWAARVLLSLRFLPVAFATLAVIGLCIPSYLSFEPEAAVETAGLFCLGAAMLGLSIWVMAFARAIRAAVRSSRYVGGLRRGVREQRFWFGPLPARIVEGPAPILALAGVVRPRLLVSRTVLDALSGRQLDMAVRHEAAHRTSRDNLKRLLILLAPGILPFCRGLDALERAWARFMERAADDRAAGADARDSLSLAEALVQMARLGAVRRPVPLATSLIGDDRDLQARVDRLLSHRPAPANPDWIAVTGLSVALSSLLCLLALTLHPSTLASAHHLLEQLMR